MHGTWNQDTHLYPPDDNSSVYLITTCAVHWVDHQWNAERAGNLQTPHIIPHPFEMTLPRRVGSGLTASLLVSDVFRFCLYKWGMASTAACECGAEEQTIDHVVLKCLIHWPPHGLHGLTVLDKTIEWLLNTLRASVWYIHTSISSSADCARELCKGSNGSTSLVCTWKQIFCLGSADFLWVTS